MKRAFGGWRSGLGVACTLAATAVGCNAILGNTSSTTDDHLFDDAGAEASAIDSATSGDTSPANDACPMGLAACGSGCTDVTTDRANCGQCGKICGGSCVASECLPIVLATGLNVPVSIGVDATHVYWTDRGTGTGGTANGAVAKVVLDGGAIENIVSPADQPGALAIDATGATQIIYGAAGKNVYSVNADGTGSNTFNNTGLAETHALAFNASVVFGIDTSSHLWSEPRAGNQIPVTDPTGSLPVGLAVEGTEVFVSQKGTCADPDGVIEKGFAGNIGSSQEWLTGQNCPTGIAASSLYVYFANHGAIGGSDGAIMKALRTANTASPIVGNLSSPTAIAIDATSVFWIEDGASGSIASANLDGSNHRVLATKQVHPVALALDATNVYWLTQGLSAGNGAVNRMKK